MSTVSNISPQYIADTYTPCVLLFKGLDVLWEEEEIIRKHNQAQYTPGPSRIDLLNTALTLYLSDLKTCIHQRISSLQSSQPELYSHYDMSSFHSQPREIDNQMIDKKDREDCHLDSFPGRMISQCRNSKDIPGIPNRNSAIEQPKHDSSSSSERNEVTEAYERTNGNSKSRHEEENKRFNSKSSLCTSVYEDNALIAVMSSTVPSAQLPPAMAALFAGLLSFPPALTSLSIAVGTNINECSSNGSDVQQTKIVDCNSGYTHSNSWLPSPDLLEQNAGLHSKGMYSSLLEFHGRYYRYWLVEQEQLRKEKRENDKNSSSYKTNELNSQNNDKNSEHNVNGKFENEGEKETERIQEKIMTIGTTPIPHQVSAIMDHTLNALHNSSFVRDTIKINTSISSSYYSSSSSFNPVDNRTELNTSATSTSDKGIPAINHTITSSSLESSTSNHTNSARAFEIQENKDNKSNQTTGPGGYPTAMTSQHSVNATVNAIKLQQLKHVRGSRWFRNYGSLSEKTEDIARKHAQKTHNLLQLYRSNRTHNTATNNSDRSVYEKSDAGK